MRHLVRVAALVACWLGACLPAGPVAADEVYQEPHAFIAEMLSASAAEQALDLSAEDIKSGESLLHRKIRQTHYRYWEQDAKRVWILEEIGKYQPITAGFLVSDDKIAQARVLVYRESHGAEVHEPFFVDQFVGLSLTEKNKLSKGVNGISGATLSVNAMRKMAQFALYLDSLAPKAPPSP